MKRLGITFTILALLALVGLILSLLVAPLSLSARPAAATPPAWFDGIKVVAGTCEEFAHGVDWDAIWDSCPGITQANPHQTVAVVIHVTNMPSLTSPFLHLGFRWPSGLFYGCGGEPYTGPHSGALGYYVLGLYLPEQGLHQGAASLDDCHTFFATYDFTVVPLIPGIPLRVGREGESKQAILSGIQTELSFNTLYGGARWDASYPSRLYAQYDGYYQASGTVTVGGGDNTVASRLWIGVRSNGSTYQYGSELHTIPYQAAQVSIISTPPFFLHAGEYIEMVVYQNQGHTIYLVNNYPGALNNFQGTLWFVGN